MKNIMKSIRWTGAVTALAVSIQITMPTVSSAQYRPVSRVSQPPASSSAGRTSSAPQRASVSSEHASPPSPTSAPREPARVSATPATRSESTAIPHPAAPSVRENSRPESAATSRSQSAASNRPTATAQPASPRNAKVKRADGSRVVTAGGQRGFVEHSVPGRPGFAARTYVAGGRSYVRVYRSYSIRGIAFQRYVQAFYFQPAFYSWAYNPWPRLVAFSWGYYSAPWYAYYSPYFAPAPVYGVPALWLTDFLIAENLKAAYESGQTAPQEMAQSAPITPEIKGLVSNEVGLELATERKVAENKGPSDQDVTPAALDPRQCVFVVSMNLEVSTENNQSCALTPGDIILRPEGPAGDDGNINLTVLSSKAGNCHVASKITVDVATLEEMHNDLRQQIDSGLSVLAQNQGKGGLPAGPAANPTIVQDGQAPVDLDATNAVISQQQAALKNQ